ncbi:hypothetical protein WJX72_003399 [[Myrmecia] bisecta]|uniref:Numb-like protein n=1 Tax=[Myrmecia] bisecta TaxID=41462 RepID=A0AAW1PMF5_9CHLO
MPAAPGISPNARSRRGRATELSLPVEIGSPQSPAFERERAEKARAAREQSAGFVLAEEEFPTLPSPAGSAPSTRSTPPSTKKPSWSAQVLAAHKQPPNEHDVAWLDAKARLREPPVDPQAQPQLSNG